MKSVITKILLWLLGALIVVYIILTGAVKDELNMASKVGARLGGGELSIRENTIVASCINTYLQNIADQKYENAYGMLGASYRNHTPYEEWLIKAQSLDISNMIVKRSDIEIISKTTFCVPVAIGDDTTNYLVIINNNTNRFAIYPNEFLDYNNDPKQLTEQKITYTIKDYEVYGEKIILKLNVNNKNKKQLSLTNIALDTVAGNRYEYSGDILVDSTSENTYTLEFKNDFSFPTNLAVYAKLDGKLMDEKISIDF